MQQASRAREFPLGSYFHEGSSGDLCNPLSGITLRQALSVVLQFAWVEHSGHLQSAVKAWLHYLPVFFGLVVLAELSRAFLLVPSGVSHLVTVSWRIMWLQVSMGTSSWMIHLCSAWPHPRRGWYVLLPTTLQERFQRQGIK